MGTAKLDLLVCITQSVNKIVNIDTKKWEEIYDEPFNVSGSHDYDILDYVEAYPECVEEECNSGYTETYIVESDILEDGD